jgi:hypothetical protein
LQRFNNFYFSNCRSQWLIHFGDFGHKKDM